MPEHESKTIELLERIVRRHNTQILFLEKLMASLAQLQTSADALTAAVKARNDAPPPAVVVPDAVVAQIDAATAAINPPAPSPDERTAA